MKKYFYVFGCLFLLFFSCTQPVNNYDGLSAERIVIDNSLLEDQIDLSVYLSDSFDMIPLETTDDCLLSEIKKVQIKGERIYVSDKINPGVFVFDMNGKFMQKIGKQGNGPNEFVYMGTFYIVDNLLYIQDLYGYKYLIFDVGEDVIERFPYKIHHLEMIPFASSMYFVTNYFISDMGAYNLYRYDKKNNEMEPHLPFDDEINKRDLAWGLNKYSSIYGDTALLIYPRESTIYEVTNELVYPVYQIEFSNHILSTDMKDKKGAFRFALEEGYNVGLSYLEHNKELILATYIEKRYRYLLIDKNTSSYRIGKKIANKNIGSISFYNYVLTSNDEMITFFDASVLKDNWSSIYSKNSFRTQVDRDRIETIVDNLEETDNPVVFRFKFK